MINWRFDLKIDSRNHLPELSPGPDHWYRIGVCREHQGIEVFLKMDFNGSNGLSWIWQGQFWWILSSISLDSDGSLEWAGVHSDGFQGLTGKGNGRSQAGKVGIGRSCVLQGSPCSEKMLTMFAGLNYGAGFIWGYIIPKCIPSADQNMIEKFSHIFLMFFLTTYFRSQRFPR